MKKFLLVLLATAAAPWVNAGQITFDWTTSATSEELLSGSGYWTMDESEVIPSSYNAYAAVITDFAFYWTTATMGSFSLTPSNGFLNVADMGFDALGQLTQVTVCASAVVVSGCSAVHPSIQVSNSVPPIAWLATFGENQFNLAIGTDTFTQTVSDVPEPRLLSLLALGLLLLARQRYRSLSYDRT
ncbi:MAG: hypothetical protein R3E64_00195 [Halioglobus sp.]